MTKFRSYQEETIGSLSSDELCVLFALLTPNTNVTSCYKRL